MDTKSIKVIKKRQRSENWLEEDKHLLMDLVRERVAVIENKNTDTNSNSKKLAAWADLLISFNNMCKGGVRTLPQLKSQWGIIKMTQKKLKSEERKYILKTGGGPPPPKDPENTDISSWLPNEFVIDINEFDSDQINQIQVREPLPANNEVKVDDLTNDQTAAEVKVVETIVVEPLDNATNTVVDVTSHILQEVQNTPEVIYNHTPRSVKRPPATYKKSSKLPKIENTCYVAATNNIAQTEVECRKELHEIQMENEKRKARNLDLEEILIRKKIEYYAKKI